MVIAVKSLLLSPLKTWGRYKMRHHGRVETPCGTPGGRMEVELRAWRLHRLLWPLLARACDHPYPGVDTTALLRFVSECDMYV